MTINEDKIFNHLNFIYKPLNTEYMKTTLITLVIVLIAITVIAQSPQAFKYQAVARDNTGNALANQNVKFRIGILQGSASGTLVYSETHLVTTNQFGLANMEIGNGTVISGVFADIDWGANISFLQIEMDETGSGSFYELMGTSQLLSVPYSLYSGSTGDTTRWKKINDDLYYDNGNVGVGTQSPHTSAALDVESTDKGVLIPRLNEAEISLIMHPVNGLTVFNTDDNRFYFYDGQDDVWLQIAVGTGSISPGYNEVTNPVTGRTWLDRNLGATQVAVSSTDAAAYGDLYQWGRATEGHESRTSNTTSTNATTADPNAGNSWDGLFILEINSPYDWLTPQVDTLWLGASGTNNPCPTGFRIPTEAEWDAERISWATNNAAGAYGSPLKLTVGGYRKRTDGSLTDVGSDGYYWSAPLSGIYVYLPPLYLSFSSSDTYIGPAGRGQGFSIRCIKE